MKTTELDKKFDEGKEDIVDAFDLESGHRINHEQKRVQCGFPKMDGSFFGSGIKSFRNYTSIAHQNVDC